MSEVPLYHESHPTAKVIVGRLLPTLGRKLECKVEVLSVYWCLSCFW